MKRTIISFMLICVLYVYSMFQICKDVTFFCRNFAVGNKQDVNEL